MILNVIELTLVEEPELERVRLGAGYSEYRKRVPMFIPEKATVSPGAAEEADEADGRLRPRSLSAAVGAAPHAE